MPKGRMRGIYAKIFSMNKENIKHLRKNMTEFEIKLWKYLRDRRFCKVKFRRQVPIKNYIVDFICFEKGVVIELDGSGHVGNEYDKERDEIIRSEGFKILRFWNNDVSNNFEQVMDEIYRSVQ